MSEHARPELGLLSGSGHPTLGASIAAALAVEPVARTLGRFPDGERQVLIDSSIRGDDVYIVQSMAPPVDEQLMELLLMADACRREGAARVTAVIPYLAYARQDRRKSAGQPISARVVADLLSVAGAHRVLLLDPHGGSALEGLFEAPTEQVTAVPALTAALQEHLQADGAQNMVVVAPDLGAVKLAERYAAILELPVAIVRKQRLSGSDVRALEVVGDVRDRTPIIVDDMISTGGTIEAAIEALIAAGGRSIAIVAATHGLFTGGALERLRGLPIGRLLVTDSLPPAPGPHPMLEVVSVAPILAEGIARLHREQPLGELSMHA